MRAEYSNSFPDHSLESFSRIIKSTNDFFTNEKLIFYGLEENKVSQGTEKTHVAKNNQGEKLALASTGLTVFLGKADEKNGICQEKGMVTKIVKNPFKQKLRQQLGLN